MSIAKVRQSLEKFASEHKQDKMFVSWGEVSQEEKRSTGSLLLDDLLGGGYVAGSISQWYGLPSGGKCLPKDTYIYTENGHLKIEEIFNEKGLNCVNKHQVKKGYEYSFVNRYNQLEKTTHFTFNGKKLLKKFKTNFGQEIKSTCNHPHLTIDNNGFLVWRKTDEFIEGDYLLINRSSHFGKTDIDKDDAYMLGCLIADGHFGKNRIGFTNDDPFIKTFFESNAQRIFESEYKSYMKKENNSSISYQINNTVKAKQYYEKYGLEPCLSKGKHIPKIIRQANQESVKAFIQGFMDCECWIYNSTNSIEVCSASKELLTQLKLLLQQFGIISSLNVKVVKSYPDNQYYRLAISGKNYYKYYTRIGTRSNVRVLQFKEVVESSKDFDIIPNIKNIMMALYKSDDSTNRDSSLILGSLFKDRNITYSTLNRFIDLEIGKNSLPDLFNYLKSLLDLNYYYDRIDEIKELQEEETFDFTMENSHSFIANGVVTHNTSIVTHICSEYQKQGKLIAYLDCENAMDVNYALNTFGFNVLDESNVLFSQEENASNVYEIVETCAENGFSLVVIDSTDAMFTTAEEEGEYGDAHMGQMARMNSQALKKLKGILKKNNCDLMMISQVRSNIGGYGGGETCVTPDTMVEVEYR